MMRLKVYSILFHSKLRNSQEKFTNFNIINRNQQKSLKETEGELKIFKIIRAYSSKDLESFNLLTTISKDSLFFLSFFFFFPFNYVPPSISY